VSVDAREAIVTQDVGASVVGVFEEIVGWKVFGGINEGLLVGATVVGEPVAVGTLVVGSLVFLKTKSGIHRLPGNSGM